jgi:predicted porin
MTDRWPSRHARALGLAAAAALTSPAALAQSNVSLSGIMDLAVRSTSNQGAGSMKSMVSGSNSTSRIIFSGREDLGGGMFAGFHLEHGILADTGSAASSAKYWDRRSTVSLSHAAWGELRLGRDFVPSYNNWSRYDPFAYVGAARSANLVSATPVGPIRSAFGTNANTTVRADNGLQWRLPSRWGGLEGEVMLAPGEGGLATAGNAKLVGLRLGYGVKDWSVSAASTRSTNSLTTTGRFTDTVLGGHWQVTPRWRLSAAWREFEQGSATQTLTMLAAVATFGQHELKASWLQTDLSGRVGTTAIGANDATQIGLGYVYHLSRRSALYATAAQIGNDGAARFVLSDGPAGIVAGGRSRGYEMGMRHRF